MGNAQPWRVHKIGTGSLDHQLLGVCNSKYKFAFIHLLQYGYANDSTVLRNSEHGKRLESYSLNILPGDIVDKQYFKDGESFLFPY